MKKIKKRSKIKINKDYVRDLIIRIELKHLETGLDYRTILESMIKNKEVYYKTNYDLGKIYLLMKVLSKEETKLKQKANDLYKNKP